MDLNNNYRMLQEDKYFVLQFHEIREGKKLNTETRKYEGTGEFKEFKENFYFNTMESLLRNFLYMIAEEGKTAEGIINAVNTGVEEILKTINQQSIKI